MPFKFGTAITESGAVVSYTAVDNSSLFRSNSGDVIDPYILLSNPTCQIKLLEAGMNKTVRVSGYAKSNQKDWLLIGNEAEYGK